MVKFEDNHNKFWGCQIYIYIYVCNFCTIDEEHEAGSPQGSPMSHRSGSASPAGSGTRHHCVTLIIKNVLTSFWLTHSCVRYGTLAKSIDPDRRPQNAVSG